MSSFFSFLPADGWQRLLCDALWQSTLIAGLGWLMARFLVRQSAARAWLMLMTLIACAIVPLASMAARANGWTVLTADSDRIPLPVSNSVTITSADVEQFVQELSSQPIEPDPSAAAVLTPTDDRPIDELNADNSSPAAVQSSAAKSAVAVILTRRSRTSSGAVHKCDRTADSRHDLVSAFGFTLGTADSGNCCRAGQCEMPCLATTQPCCPRRRKRLEGSECLARGCFTAVMSKHRRYSHSGVRGYWFHRWKRLSETLILLHYPPQLSPRRMQPAAFRVSERRVHPSIGSPLSPMNWPTSPAATAGRGWRSSAFASRCRCNP